MPSVFDDDWVELDQAELEGLALPDDRNDLFAKMSVEVGFRDALRGSGWRKGLSVGEIMSIPLSGRGLHH